MNEQSPILHTQDNLNLKPQIPDVDTYLDQEVKKVALWPEPRGLNYEIAREKGGAITNVVYGTTQVDGHVTRVFHVERVTPIKKNVTVREPTIFEMARFYEVAKRAFPDLLLIEIMKGEIRHNFKNKKSELYDSMWAATDIAEFERLQKLAVYVEELAKEVQIDIP